MIQIRIYKQTNKQNPVELKRKFQNNGKQIIVIPIVVPFAFGTKTKANQKLGQTKKKAWLTLPNIHFIGIEFQTIYNAVNNVLNHF